MTLPTPTARHSTGLHSSRILSLPQYPTYTDQVALSSQRSSAEGIRSASNAVHGSLNAPPRRIVIPSRKVERMSETKRVESLVRQSL